MKLLPKSQRGYFASMVGAYGEEYGGSYIVDYINAMGKDMTCYVTRAGNSYEIDKDSLPYLDQALIKQIRDEVNFIMSIIGDTDD